MTTRDFLIGPSAHIPPGEGRIFHVGGQRVAVFHARDGAIYATQASCPHRGGPLADGLMGGATLICPLHGWTFNLATGAAIRGECGLQTYSVRRNASDDLIISIPEPVGATAALAAHSD